MGHRNMLCTSQMMDSLMDEEERHHLHPDSHILVGSMTNFTQPAPGSTPTLDIQCVSQQYNNATYFEMMPYTDPATTSNFYNPYMTPSANTTIFGVSLSNCSSEQLPSYCNQEVSGMSLDEQQRDKYLMDDNRASYKMAHPSANTLIFGVSLGDGSPEQLPSYCNQQGIAMPSDEYRRNNNLMDANRSSYKRKNVEGGPGNLWHFESSASSSSSISAADPRHLEPGVAMMNSEYLAPIQVRRNDSPSVIMEVGPHRTLRNISGAPVLNAVMAHTESYLVPGTYMGQPFGVVPSPWLDREFNNNHVDGALMPWNQAPAAPHLHGSSVSGSYMETGTFSLQGYHEAAGNSSTNLLPPFQPRQHNFYHIPQAPVQEQRNPNVDFSQEGAASSFRVPMNNMPQGYIDHSQDGLNTGLRQRGSLPPTSLRIYRPNHWGAVPEASRRPNNRPFLRILPTDEISILEFQEYHETGHITDHYRDMRMDIEDMSYEELLALGERIGNVSTGLSEETVQRHLKTRIHSSSAMYINLEEPACEDQETDSCSICQTDFENQEKVGILNCGHEYHAHCLEKWLLVKNICPICKSSALPSEKK